jgi:transketolase
MASICNGMAAYGGFVPYSATFLVFVCYNYPAVRLSALVGHQQLYIMTHDSIGLGEDGPTHQPIESLAICRALPNCLVFRPADGNEVSGAYAAAIEHRHGPSVLALTRQAVPHLAGTTAAAVERGMYSTVLCEKQEPTLKKISPNLPIFLFGFMFLLSIIH